MFSHLSSSDPHTQSSEQFKFCDFMKNRTYIVSFCSHTSLDAEHRLEQEGFLCCTGTNLSFSVSQPCFVAGGNSGWATISRLHKIARKWVWDSASCRVPQVSGSFWASCCLSVNICYLNYLWYIFYIGTIFVHVTNKCFNGATERSVGVPVAVEASCISVQNLSNTCQ